MSDTGGASAAQAADHALRALQDLERQLPRLDGAARVALREALAHPDTKGDAHAARAADAPPEPVRTLHHFACAGGTLISKFVASMPNVQLLSEVDPLAPLNLDPSKPRFAPTDMGVLLRQSSRGTDEQALLRVFQRELVAVHDDARRKGQRLVLRDHAHSHFCRGADVPVRPTLRQIVAEVLPVRSVLTVRHPLDSLASLRKAGWVHFAPATADEYARRYLAFLAAHDGVPRMRYEDIVRAPEASMQTLCDWLALPYSPDFATVFSALHISGDSGRRRDDIGLPPRRPEAAALAAEAASSAPWATLLDALGYAADDPVASLPVGP